MSNNSEQYSELKRLAGKAYPLDKWYKPGDLRYADEKTGELHGLHHDDDGFIAAANPAAVLALIAENERVESAWHDMKRELDQLKAEVEGLRKDAQRYKWLRSRDLDSIGKGGVFAGMTPENLVLNEDDLDAAIDAATANEEKAATVSEGV